jgi:hypothetical protein
LGKMLWLVRRLGIFVSEFEGFLGVNRTHADLDAAWNSTKPAKAPSTLQDMLHYVRFQMLLTLLFTAG